MSDTTAIALSLEHSSSTPVFVQIYRALRQRISSGTIESGSRLPPSRSFAVDLGVSRTTVVAAYEQLAAEGYVESRRGSGFYVCPMGQVELSTSDTVNRKPMSTHWTETRSLQHPGEPDMRLFPYRQWARCVARTARLAPEALITSEDAFGDRALREAIARYLVEWRGLHASPRQILITAGSGDALELCIRTLAHPGVYIGLEDPGYLPLRHCVSQNGMMPLWLRVQPDGVAVPQSSQIHTAPKLIFLTPSYQFPLGGVMSLSRRMEFLNWAVKIGAWIIEDDYDSEFRYAGRPIPALAGFDRSGRTIYVGSFAKIFSNGLRLGFLVAPDDLIAQFSHTLARFGTKASIAPQRALAAFMDSGDFYRHIRRVRRVYAERRRVLLDLLDTELGHLVSFSDHQAGMQIALRLPSDCDDQALAQAAALDGVGVVALSTHYAQAQTESGLLLGFCAFTAEEIKRNVEIIRERIEHS